MLASYVIFFALAIINTLCGLCKRNEKILYYSALAVIFIFMTFNCMGPDIGEYFSAYDSALDLSGTSAYSGHMESGYVLIMYVCKKIGLDFFSFRTIISIICFFLFSNTIKYYKVNGNLIVGLYMTYLFFFDTIQLRNCIVEFLLLFATRYLLRKSLLSTLKYILIIVVASMFHVAALFGLPLLLVKFLRKESHYRVIIILSALLFVACMAMQSSLPKLANWLLQFIGRGSSYLEINVEIGYLVVLILHLMGLIPLYLLKGSIENNRLAKSQVTFILRINIILCLFIPLLFFNSNFYRLYRNYILLTYIGLALIYRNSRTKTSIGGLAAVVMLLMNAGWFVRDMFIKNDINVIIKPIFEGSLFSGFIQPIMVWQWIAVGAIAVLAVAIIKILVPERGRRLYARAS